MRITLKNQPRLQLADLLRRRKMSLHQFVTEHAITTYEGLRARCEAMGVAPPDEEAYRTGVPSKDPVNSPQEGIIVVEPPHVIDEMSGRSINTAAPINPGIDVVIDRQESFDMPTVDEPVGQSEPSVNTPKRLRKKKDVPPNP